MGYFGDYFGPYFGGAAPAPVVETTHGGLLLNPPPNWLAYTPGLGNGPLYPERKRKRRKEVPEALILGTVEDVMRTIRERHNAEDEWVLGLITEWEN